MKNNENLCSCIDEKKKQDHREKMKYYMRKRRESGEAKKREIEYRKKYFKRPEVRKRISEMRRKIRREAT